MMLQPVAKNMETEKVKHRYDRIAPLYDILEFPMENMVSARLRRELLSGIGGKILEVGIGTGKNLPYYPKNAMLTGIDISPGMLAHTRRKASELKIEIALSIMDTEKLAFSEGCFDFVVSTFVFCSVADPVRGLREIKRVLKTNGTALFLEHVRSENLFFGKLMDAVNPFVRKIIGPNINRRTVENIKNAGFTPVQIKSTKADIIKQIWAKPTSVYTGKQQRFRHESRKGA